MLRHLFILVAVCLAAMPGCAGPLPAPKRQGKPTLAPDARPKASVGLSDAEISQAAKLCSTKCLRCHAMYDPAAYNETEWRSWTDKMTKKAHLKPQQSELLWRYLGGFRAQ